jgi:hypothetical protein
MKPWEVVATILAQLRVFGPDGAPLGQVGAFFPGILCLRTGERITLDNVRDINVEHWPRREKHGGEVAPENALISLAAGHKVQTKREQKSDAKERRLTVARLAKHEVERRVSRGKFRLKKKLNGDVVRVRVR